MARHVIFTGKKCKHYEDDNSMYHYLEDVDVSIGVVDGLKRLKKQGFLPLIHIYLNCHKLTDGLCLIGRRFTCIIPS